MKKYCRTQTGFIWHRIGTSGREFEHIKLLIKVRGFLEWASVSGSLYVKNIQTALKLSKSTLVKLKFMFLLYYLTQNNITLSLNSKPLSPEDQTLSWL